MDIVVGVLFIALGLAAMVLPVLTAFTAALLVAWTLIAAGIVSFFRALSTDRIDGMQALVGIVYVAIAIAIFRHPFWGVASLAIVVAAALMVDGLIEMAFYFTASGLPGSTWLLMTATVTLILGFVIFNLSITTPASAVAALVGVRLLAGGTGQIMTALADRLVNHTRA